MKYYQNSKLFKYIYLIIFVFCVESTAYAAVSISVNPTEGGGSIRFGRVDMQTSEDKEVRIRSTNTETQQYQIFQRLSEPLINERGQALNRSVIITSTLPATNASGTLYLQNQEKLGYAEQLVYTSSSTGTPDTFSVIYRVDPDDINVPGTFSGKILYSIRPIGGGAEQQVVLNVFLDVSGDLLVKTEGSSGLNFVELDSLRKDRQEGYFKIDFADAIGYKTEFYQEIIDFPRNEQGKELSDKLLEFNVSNKRGTVVGLNDLKNYQRGQVLLHETDADNGTLMVNFKLNDKFLDHEEAGTYQGLVRYTVQSSSDTQSFDCRMKIKISPVFKIEIEYPPEGVSFSNLIPTGKAQEREVLVRVKSNMGRPYMISQDMQAPLTNEEGGHLVGKNFTMKQEFVSEKQKGKIGFSNFSEVKEGDSSLYYSDELGSPVEFRVIYRLQPAWNLQSGNYQSLIRYSLEEI